MRSAHAPFRTLAALALPVLLMTGLGCKPKGPKTPAWAAAAPDQATMAFSVQAGWVLDHQNVQQLVSRFPMADQMLDLFLKKAHINPHDDPGRVTFFVLDGPTPDVKDLKAAAGQFLILLDGFKDPAALQSAVVESFPQEGSLTLDGKDAALHVILDLNEFHLRAALDCTTGRIWLGDLKALTRRAAQGSMTRKAPLAAMEWIDPKGTFQGFLQPQTLLASLKGQLPQNLGLDIPEGMEALAWSVSPAPTPQAPHRLDLAVTGSPEGIQQVTPWLQRIGALATAAGPNAAPPPDIAIERTRAGLRASMTEAQLNAVLGKLGTMPLHFSPPKGPKA